MKYYFTLQYKMLNRKIIEFGLPPTLGYLLAIALFIGLSFMLFLKVSFANYIYLAIALSSVTALSEDFRNDFLKSIFSNQEYLRIRFIENAILGIPFVLFFLFKQEWLLAFILPLTTGSLALFNFRNQLNYTIPTPFTKFPFEFIIGFRNTYYLFGLSYFLTLMAIQVGNFNLGIFTILLVFGVCLSFYAKPEEEYFVWIFSKNPQAFLFSKIWFALICATILVLPIIIGLMIFFSSNWWIVLIVLCAGYLYLITMVLAKYAAYPREINVPQAIIITLGVWLPPLLLGIIPFFYNKSIKNLYRWL